MKPHLFLLAALASCLCVATPEARASFLPGATANPLDPFTFDFDNLGNGLLDINGTGFVLNDGVMAPDPTQAGNPLELTYYLPGPVVNGDIRIWGDVNETDLIGVLAFTDPDGDLTGQTGDRMIFYSADTGIPASLVPNDGGGIVAVNDVFQWAPGGPGDNVYNGVFAVPEPSILVLSGLGAGIFLFAARRRNYVVLAVVGVLVLAATRATAQPFKVVNVIPNSQSAETEQNAEPSIAVSPVNPVQMWISAFATGFDGFDDMGNPLCPYFMSANGGGSWTIPISRVHGDTTMTWSPSGNLYTAILGPMSGQTTILGAPGSIYPTPAANEADQPWVVVANVGGKDRLYVGLNDRNQPKGQTSTVRWTADATAGAGGWTTLPLDPALVPGGDGIPVRLAANGNIVYVAFQRYDPAHTTIASVVVRRSANGGTDKFMAPGKNGNPMAAAVVANAILTTPNSDYLGNGPGNAAKSSPLIGQALGGDLAIAVDPNDSNKVYVAWAQLNGRRQATPPGQPQVHVAITADGGETWKDIFQTAASAGLPSLAVAGNGTVGLLYTLFDGANLRTHFAQFPGGDFTKPTDAELAWFQNGIPGPDVAHYRPGLYLGDFQYVVALGNRFYGAFCSGNDPNSAHFPQGVFFQRSFYNQFAGAMKNALLPANGTNALIDNQTNFLTDLSNQAKWLQVPDVDDGLDVKATQPLILADDFQCNATGPITGVTVWGSWVNDNVPDNATICLSFWSDASATTDSNGVVVTPSHPNNLLWSYCFTNAQDLGAPIDLVDFGGNHGDPEDYLEECFDPSVTNCTDAIFGFDTEVWQYNFTIPTNQAFGQTSNTVYWLSVTASGFDTNKFTFGWKTTPDVWNDNAVFAEQDSEGGMSDWQELFRPCTNDSLDLAFAIDGTDPHGLSIDPYFFTTPAAAPLTNQWSQPPDSSTNGLDVRATTPKILADDFFCLQTGPITGITIWGSWLNDAVWPQPCFCLGIWSDVPAVTDTNGTVLAPSHPGEQLWTNCLNPGQYAYSFFTNASEQFFDPNLNAIVGADTQIWEYDFTFPTNQAFTQTNGTVYWLSVTAGCFDTNQFLFGWKTTPQVWNDNAVFSDLDASGNLTRPWEELIRPGTTNSLDLAFALTMPPPTPLPTNVTSKVLQRPDASPTGIDLLSGNAGFFGGAGIRVLADDFLCTNGGYISGITIWGSWLTNGVDPNTTFVLSFWTDTDTNGPSQPGALLWQQTFAPGGYATHLYASNIFFETFSDPAWTNAPLGLDSQVYEYDFAPSSTNGFFQWQGNVYWLSVRALTTSGLFGWKTSIDHFEDEATWTWQLDPEDWDQLTYPPWHPYSGDAIDLSFELTTVAATAPLLNTSGASALAGPMVLSVSRPNGALTLQWNGNGVLQWAPEMNGPWTTITSATNPYVAPANLPRCFFRVVPP
jgi:hypothetical protein